MSFGKVIGKVDDVHHPQLGALGDAAGVAGGEVVDHRDALAVGKQRVDQVRADQPGTAGDDHARGHARESIGTAWIGSRRAGLRLRVTPEFFGVGAFPLHVNLLTLIQARKVGMASCP